MSFRVPESYRVREGDYGTTAADGNNGAFVIRYKGVRFVVFASDGHGWEHVSISTHTRTPTWDEMCHFKSLFWDAEDVAMQLHPRESDYVNRHKFCLHLWRPTNAEIPTPPRLLV